MDGNGRWAQHRGLLRVDGHFAGIDAVKRVVRASLEKKIGVLSLFAFSSENWSRPEQEVDFLMNAFVQALDDGLQEWHEKGVRLFFSGERAQLSAELRSKMQASEELTHKNDQLRLNIAINYSGKWDIIHAVKLVARQVALANLRVDDINETMFSQCLSTHGLPDPDLLIRTSGEQRLSNFFLWQSAYTEIYFSPTYWPDFNEETFDEALSWYARRERRFGLISEQLMDKQDV